MKRKISIVLTLVIVFSVVTSFLNYDSAAAGRIILFPGQGTWYICQGYNTPEISHKGKDIYAFDLSTSSQSYSGSYGCSTATNNASTGQKIYSPAKGTIIASPSGHPDIMQIKLVSGGCVRVAHLTTSLKVGASVYQGQLLGTITGPNSLNGNYAHLHISAYSDNYCNDPVPFTSSYGYQLYGAINFPSSGARYEHRKKSITQDYPPQGVNLNAYCVAKGYASATLIGSTVYDWRCKSSSGSLVSIDMYKVCEWQFQGLLPRPAFGQASDPGSWKCNIR